ncbi:hypothetical protein TNCV_3152521 [Trichonephila clavipes]|nr:hypothetical protein TNCV_3152521 [Trichonephila clavipes]
MGTGESYTGSLVNRGGIEARVSASLGEELLYQLRSQFWCVAMQNIPVVLLLELRPFTTKGFSQTTASRRVYLQQFVQVFDDDLFERDLAPKQNFSRSVKSVIHRVHLLRWINGPLENVDAIRKLGFCYGGSTIHFP